MNPSTVAITLNYRDVNRTSKCLRSLLQNKLDHILVWDNSADEGASARQLLDQWQLEQRITIHVSPNNLGFAAGVNRAIEHLQNICHIDRLLLINNDAYLPRDSIRELNLALDKHPDAAIAYPTIDNKGTKQGTAYYQRHSGILSFGKPLPGSFPYVTGCALLISMRNISLPLLDEDFFMYGEDAFLGWRIGAKRMVYVPDVLVRHDGSASSKSGSLFYETCLVSGHWLLAQKLSLNPADKVLLYMGRCLFLPLRALVRSVRLRSLIPLRALINKTSFSGSKEK